MRGAGGSAREKKGRHVQFEDCCASSVCDLGKQTGCVLASQGERERYLHGSADLGGGLGAVVGEEFIDVVDGLDTGLGGQLLVRLLRGDENGARKSHNSQYRVGHVKSRTIIRRGTGGLSRAGGMCARTTLPGLRISAVL
jgi:hypothetical protein